MKFTIEKLAKQEKLSNYFVGENPHVLRTGVKKPALGGLDRAFWLTGSWL
jgi:hypothetical protein